MGKKKGVRCGDRDEGGGALERRGGKEIKRLRGRETEKALTRMYGKASPTMKFASQFTMVAIVTASGLAS